MPPPCRHFNIRRSVPRLRRTQTGDAVPRGRPIRENRWELKTAAACSERDGNPRRSLNLVLICCRLVQVISDGSAFIREPERKVSASRQQQEFSFPQDDIFFIEISRRLQTKRSFRVAPGRAGAGAAHPHVSFWVTLRGQMRRWEFSPDASSLRCGCDTCSL